LATVLLHDAQWLNAVSHCCRLRSLTSSHIPNDITVLPATAQTMVLTLYGPVQEDAYTYPVCTPFDQDDAPFEYDKYYSYYESGVHVRMRELDFVP
jgi:hypothetical protein